jgi:serine protease AprX
MRPSCLILAFLCIVLCPSTAQAGVDTDLDRDKVFDDLERRLTDRSIQPILVKLREPATAARVDAIEDALGDLGSIERLRLVDAFAARATREQIQSLARRPDVAHVEEDALVVPFGVTAQAAFGVTRAREDIPDLDGEGLVAAVIDSGIDTTMPDLPASKVVAFKDFVNGSTVPYDDLGHGSLVSGILAGAGTSGAEGRGVAPAARLVSVKVIDHNAQGSLSKIAQGIQWVVENRELYGIDAINLSIGDPIGCGDGTDVASQAVDAAVTAGILVVAAAGNAGPATCTIKSPAAAESALTVGAMADTGAGGFFHGYFSSRGPTADDRIKPDVTAAGVDVVMPSPAGGYIEGTGTSAAAPFTTGAALLMLQTHPGLTPVEVKAAITGTAVDWGRPGRDVEYGAGRLDVYAALRALGAPLAVPPAVPRHEVWSGTLAEKETASRDVEVTASGVPLAVTMLGPDDGFDVTLHDSSGANVGTAVQQPTPSRQEVITLAVPSPGRYTIRVHAFAGDGSFAVDVSGALAPADTTAPHLTLELDVLTRDDTPGLRGDVGTAIGDFPGVVARVLREGQVVHRLAGTPLLGRWTLDVPKLNDGEYSVEVEQGDVAGNVARVPARAFVVDTVAPAAPTVSAPLDGALLRTATIQFTGSAEPGSAVAIAEGAQVLATATGGSWSRTLNNVADGAHTYSVRATDEAGNESLRTVTSVRVDTIAPTATIVTAPSGPIRTPTPTFVFASESGAGLECRIDGPQNHTGNWSACISPLTFGPLTDATYRFLVRATDAAGNVGTAAQSDDFIVDTASPAAPTIDEPGPLQKTSTVTLAGRGEAGATVTVFEGAQSRGTAGVAGTGQWSLRLDGVADGPHPYTATATDAAGNESVRTGARVVTVDTVAPAAPVISASTSGGDAAFAIVAEAGVALQCRLDGGDWSACTSQYAGLAPGAHVFEARATDAAGNFGDPARWEWTVAAPVTPPAFQPIVTSPIIDPLPVISITVGRQRLATVLRRGLSIRLGCSPACRTTLVIKHGRRTAARRTATGDATRTIRVKLSKTMRKRLAKARRVTFTVTVSAPDARTVTRKLTIKR